MKKETYKALVHIEHIFHSYNTVMKWLLNQHFSQKKKMTIYHSLTEKHWKMIFAVVSRFEQDPLPLDKK
ncbi:hypothetical protein JW930_05540 [Candidatus Woesearchaeota archaeon]|nr:hypothetical protein [Candidatus Woesearchaeota archaeon]